MFLFMEHGISSLASLNNLNSSYNHSLTREGVVVNKTFVLFSLVPNSLGDEII